MHFTLITIILFLIVLSDVSIVATLGSNSFVGAFCTITCNQRMKKNAYLKA